MARDSTSFIELLGLARMQVRAREALQFGIALRKQQVIGGGITMPHSREQIVCAVGALWNHRIDFIREGLQPECRDSRRSTGRPAFRPRVLPMECASVGSQLVSVISALDWPTQGPRGTGKRFTMFVVPPILNANADVHQRQE